MNDRDYVFGLRACEYEADLRADHYAWLSERFGESFAQAVMPEVTSMPGVPMPLFSHADCAAIDAGIEAHEAWIQQQAAARVEREMRGDE